MTRREYYVNRAAEFLVASEQTPSDRNALLHMAATYVEIAIESEYHTPPGPKASAPIDPNQAPQISIRDPLPRVKDETRIQANDGIPNVNRRNGYPWN